jgi:hypothetical protein
VPVRVVAEADRSMWAVVRCNQFRFFLIKKKKKRNDMVIVVFCDGRLD